LARPTRSAGYNSRALCAFPYQKSLMFFLSLQQPIVIACSPS
jgi:hypothetical protein